MIYIKMNFKGIGCESRNWKNNYSKYGQVKGCCVEGNEPTDSTQYGELRIDRMSNYELFKEDPIS
jgi:hypothetical protein